MRITRLEVELLRPGRRERAGAAQAARTHGPAKLVAPLSLAVLVSLTVWAVVRPPGEFDGDLLALLEPLDAGFFHPFLRAGKAATGIPVTFGLSLFALAVFLLRRRWLEAFIIAVLPAGLAVSWLLAWVVGRPSPEPELTGGSGSFPAIAVAYSTLVCGFLWFASGALVRGDAVRRMLLAVCLVLPMAAGGARIWAGENWIGDVAAGYALAGFFLAALVPAYLTMRPDLERLPLVRAAAVPHDESVPHAHALTSTVLFHNGVVYKVYNPGFVPRLFYWLSFQAPFAYANNPVALQAAVERRNLARRLTEYWFGSPRVAPAIGVCSVDGRIAIAGQFMEGHEPADHHQARAFLYDLSRRFDAAGLPTWQIDPRQPRSLGNVLEGEDGNLLIIDLESGLVSPLASPRAWWRAIRRARVPIYDDVYFDVTRAYLEGERGPMAERMGLEWLASLESQIDAAETASDAWHAMEPRLWSRALRFVYSGFGLRDIGGYIRAAREKGRAEALAWIESSIDRWEEEGRYRPGEAARARARSQDPGVQQLLPHFGVHLVIGVVLRFPLGSIARFSYTSANLLAGAGRLALRRTGRQQFRQTLSIHSPLVLLLAAMPGVGTFSYLASGPGLRNIELLRLALDGVGRRFPWQLYRRLGAQRIISRPLPRTQGGETKGAGFGDTA